MDTPCLKNSDYTCLEEGSSVNHKTKSKLSGKERIVVWLKWSDLVLRPIREFLWRTHQGTDWGLCDATWLWREGRMRQQKNKTSNETFNREKPQHTVVINKYVRYPNVFFISYDSVLNSEFVVAHKLMTNIIILGYLWLVKKTFIIILLLVKDLFTHLLNTCFFFCYGY